MLGHTLLVFAAVSSTVFGYVVNHGSTCYVYPESLSNGGKHVDDTPSILQAFDICGTDGEVILTDNTFYIDQVMNTTNLRNCDVSLHGEMIWSSDYEYWLSHSYSVVYQNQSTAWLFGGENVTFRGYGKGKLNGNGQVWYDENKGGSNQPGRPISITFFESTNTYVDGLTFYQPQFWMSFISYCNNFTMNNIYGSAISDDGNDTLNTDGTDTWNSADISLQNWTITNGDDCMAIKGNTTNLYMNNITCYQSNGIPIGSIGQYVLLPDYIENVLVENVHLYNSTSAAWVKTYPGQKAGDTSTSDGGGGGYVKNVTFRNFDLHNVSQPIFITQCTYSADPSVCDDSPLKISNMTWQNISGTSSFDVASSIHCAGLNPCPDMFFIDVNITSLNASMGLPSYIPKPSYNVSSTGELYLCANIANENTTSGIPCNGWAPPAFPQELKMNY